jgi:hypothetical protein
MADKYFLNQFPTPEELRKRLINNNFPDYRETNGHIHTPYSFSAFQDMETIFSMAKAENIAVLGINDFFVTDGFKDFYNFSVTNRIFPLFNMEFIGLMRDHQKNGIRINDPNNPGRIYISGKGLDYPFNPGLINRAKLSKVIRASQNQMKAMISKLNLLIEPVNPSMILSYEKIKGSFARDLVRERHIARAVRSAAFENYSSPEDQTRFIESLYGGKKSAAGLADNALLENEIRSNLLKNGGSAYVEEDKSTFLDIYSILGIIIKAGGIPCYPVLLDDQTGRFTDFEPDPEKLHKALESLKIGCIELIPHRNDLTILRNFIEYFYEKNYLVLIGTEHNTPEMLPLTVTARGNEQLDDDLKQIAWNSVCVIAAHQYLRAQGRQGYVLPDGNPSLKQKRELTFLGKLVIEYFLLNK